jgi:adenosylhomocysteinase
LKGTQNLEKNYLIKDISMSMEGQKKIDWVSRSMKVLNGLGEKYLAEGTFVGKKISLCIHLEAKTAHFAMVLKKLGAEVWVTSSNTLSAKDDVCAALAYNGIHVYAFHGANQDEFASFIHSIVEKKPHAVVDDGGDLCEYLHQYPEYGMNLRGICEETTTGVARLKMKYKAKQLRYPAVAINDAKSKYLFDNRYGTGQSTWTAIMHLTNMTVTGKTVVSIGYGWVGRGVATRAAGLGADIIVVETDPWKALEAKMDGFQVMPLKKACPLGDFFITSTGQPNVLKKEHFPLLKDGAFLANAGHFGYEIDIESLRNLAKSVKENREGVEEFDIESNKKIYLLARGGIINIAGGLGHPIEIMDMSFSLQLASLNYILSSDNLENKVYQVPKEIDEMIVREKLRIEGIEIE